MGKARWKILVYNFEIFCQYLSLFHHACCYLVRIPVDLVAYACRNEVVALGFLLFTGMAVGDIQI